MTGIGIFSLGSGAQERPGLPMSGVLLPDSLAGPVWDPARPPGQGWAPHSTHQGGAGHAAPAQVPPPACAAACCGGIQAERCVQVHSALICIGKVGRSWHPAWMPLGLCPSIPALCFEVHLIAILQTVSDLYEPLYRYTRPPPLTFARTSGSIPDVRVWRAKQ